NGDGGIAVFGWPNSLEDHADRACEAAWLIQNPISAPPMKDRLGRPVRFRVGVHSGLLGLRRISLDTGDRLDTVGATVYLAANLQKRAPSGGVLVSSKTQELCQAELDLVPHDEVQVLQQINAKAFVMQSRPVRPASRFAGLSYRVPLVARVEERETLRDVLVRQVGGRRSVALIGEPGIGKSRLTSAAIEDAQSSGISELVFHGDSQRRTTPYTAMRALILASLALPDAATDDAIVAAMDAAGIEDLADSPLATVLLAKRPDSAQAENSPTQTQVARSLVEALGKLVRSASRLIVIEDLHLVDPESLYCLRLMAEDKTSAWRLLLTGRPESEADAAAIAGTVLRLTPLAREEMRALATALWPDQAPPEAALEKVMDRADGIPFVLEQIVLSIGADGADSIDLAPQRVQSVIHARLNRLSPAAKSCAQGLSVLGQEVQTDIALRALDIDVAALQRDRVELESLEIIHPTTGPTLRFRHAIVAEAIAETLPRPRRRELHRASIAAIAALYPDLGAHYERLAFHAEGADDFDKALEYHWQAGLRARRSSASGSLFLIFQRAMQCIERIGEAADTRFVDLVLMACAQLLQIGEFGKMTPYLPRALELAEKQGRPDRICAALCNMGTVSWFQGRYAESREQCEKALSIAESLHNLPLIFAAKFTLASAFWGSGDLSRAIALLEELRGTVAGDLEKARLGAIAIPASMIYSYLSWFMMEVGRYEEGLAHTRRALEIAQHHAEPYSELLARLSMGRNLLKLGRYGEAADSLQAATSLIEQYGYDAIRPHVIGLRASALAGIGQATHGVSLVEGWLERGRRDRTNRLELYYLNAGYAEALARSGEGTKALAAAERALTVARTMGNPCLLVQGLGLRARLMRQFHPASPAIQADLAEQADLCRRHGLVAAA
ncbi:MAG TPA: tetratricopeptide repeat protein, partial [Reyranella sp.]|nr:tetratricopeptide repeat protein [Reyranella sp.]